MSVTDIPRIPDPSEKPACSRGELESLTPEFLADLASYLSDHHETERRSAIASSIRSARAITALLQLVDDSQRVDLAELENASHAAAMATNLLDVAFGLMNEEGRRDE